jgi:hypothetical protein
MTTPSRTERSRQRRSGPNEIRGPGGVLPVAADDEATIDLVMLIDGETSGRPLDSVLEQYRRSRSTYYEKLRRFRETGLAGLLSRPPGPQGPWRRPIEVIRFIVRSRIAEPGRSAAEIAQELSRRGHAVSVRSVERTLSQWGLTRHPSRSGGDDAGTPPTPGADQP